MQANNRNSGGCGSFKQNVTLIIAILGIGGGKNYAKCDLNLVCDLDLVCNLDLDATANICTGCLKRLKMIKLCIRKGKKAEKV